MVTGSMLEHRLERVWDQAIDACGGKVVDANGAVTVMGIDSDLDYGLGWNSGFRTVFLPLYLTATFLNCQKCGSCCQGFNRNLDRGIELTRKEAFSLREYCRIAKRDGKYMLKHPCPLLKKRRCTMYQHRPFCCRAFPVITKAGKAEQVPQGIMMACPAGKEFYKVVGLFLQEMKLYLQYLQGVGRRGLTVNDLELLKARFDYNNVSAEDMAYIRKVAGEVGLC